MAPEIFARLKRDFFRHAGERELFVQDLHAGADPAYRLPVRVICEYAWHGLFIRHLMIRPPPSDLGGFSPQVTIVDLRAIADGDRLRFYERRHPDRRHVLRRGDEKIGLHAPQLSPP